MTLVYFLKFFIHKLDASLQIVLYMVKITLTMEGGGGCNKTEACWHIEASHFLHQTPSERTNGDTDLESVTIHFSLQTLKNIYGFKL